MNLPSSLHTSALTSRIEILPRSINFGVLRNLSPVFWAELAGSTFAGILLALLIFTLGDNLLITPNLTSPNLGSANSKVNAAISLNFDRPVIEKDLSFSIEPKTPGNWVAKKHPIAGFLIKSVEFQPSVTLDPATVYTVSVNNIQSVSHLHKPYNSSFRFKTTPLPKVVKAEPANSTNNVKPNQVFKITLDSTNTDLADYKFTFAPTLKFNAIVNSDQAGYTLTPLENLKQGQSYELTIERAGLKVDLTNKKVVSRQNAVVEQKIAFTTAAAPTASISANGDAASTGPISVTFSKPMGKDAVIKSLAISPKPDYSASWSDEKTLLITPKPALPFNTFYQITLAKGTSALDGTFFESDAVYQFTTIGNVRISNPAPPNGGSGVSVKTKISLSFNQIVEHNSAQSHFSISPSVPGSFSWNGNTMTFAPASPLAYSRTYSIAESKGVKSLEALDSIADFRSQFTTQAETIRLNVPTYKQVYSLSCEFANMRMLLAYRGISVSENTLISQTPFDNTPRSGNVWGDPYAGFVGDVNGKWLTTGYGVYWDAVASILSKYGSAQAYNGWNLTSLLAEIKAGNPAIIWGCTSCLGPTYWTTPTGKKIYAYKNYHVFVVKGYIGSFDNPTHVIVNDSLSGVETTLTRNSFLTKWASFNNSAVVLH